MKSAKNKTIDTPFEQGQAYFEKCICPKGNLNKETAENLFVHGDFFKVISQMENSVFDLVIADPPYNLTKDYGGEIFYKKNCEKYEEFTRSWLKEVSRVMKDNATVYVCCDWQTSIIIANILPDFFTVRNRITWQREKGRGAKKNWKNSMEDIWFCTKGENYKFNLDAVKVQRDVLAPYKADGKPKDWTEGENGNTRFTCPSNFWDDITVPFWSMSENTAHPTQKSEKLIAKLILASSDKGDFVFDPFGGAGTTSVVAKKLGRNYFSVEKNKQYCVWAQQRLQTADTDKRIQGYENGIFLHRNAKNRK